MNIFEIYLEKIKNIIIKLSKENQIVIPDDLNAINVDIPPAQFKCDISTNVALVLSKINKQDPFELAQNLSKLIKNKDKNIDTINVAKPGFINIKFNNFFWNDFSKKVLNLKDEYGSNIKGKKLKYLIEFVSANPTGPLHVGHCRGAILGDVISNILIFNNHNVSKEYYVNDHGNQIMNFTKSVFFRIREIKYGEKFPNNNNELYPGDYIIDIAKDIISKKIKLEFDDFDKISNKLKKLAIEQSLLMIKSNLKNLGIFHDNFQSETKIIENKEVQLVIDLLKKKKFVYEGKIEAPISESNKDWVERKQLLFKSTDFGDDKDRALQKSDNSWTYFASDVAYHNNKINRNFDILINILGADHAGYIKRITSVVEALSNEKNKLICKVSQLVKLIKDNKPFKMSKRKGDYITVEDLINQVGKDATRFIMLSRSSDVELDFDFDKVKEKSKENHLYYVQYCYARICSVFRKINKDINEDVENISYDFNYGEEEIKILNKISQWPKHVDIASKKLEPHRIPVYLYELASDFHSYWNMGRDDKKKRFIDEDNKIANDKLVFLKIISNTIKIGMQIVGVNTPTKM
tara:strand:+ start:2521 stop:4254 length:1734 start_codon:yes stop_codon:yes gene_type:complete